jgi:hypothetical protein
VQPIVSAAGAILVHEYLRWLQAADPGGDDPAG